MVALPPCYIPPVNRDAYARLEGHLAYHFRDVGLLERALTHKSYVNENVDAARLDNERFEFLGDALLGFSVGALLMEAFPDEKEGFLSKARAQVVQEQGLAAVAGAIGLGEWLFLGKGEEQSGGRTKTSILADACEAVMAAVFIDGGFDAALAVVRHLFGDRVLGAGSAADDSKTRLQELSQSRLHLQPRYVTVSESGPAHDRRFLVALYLGEREYARAQGRSKKEAEQRAARAALVSLSGDEPEK